MTVKRDPISDSELSTRKKIDDQLDQNTIVRFNQTLQNFLTVSVRNVTNSLTKCNKIQLTDITTIKASNSGGFCLQSWNIKCNDAGKVQNFPKSTKTNSPTGSSGATSLPSIGVSFMYMETNSDNNGDNVFVSWERTDIIQITYITFY